MTATLNVFVGATAPGERETPLGEERPHWADENTCEIEPVVGLALPLEAVDTLLLRCTFRTSYFFYVLPPLPGALLRCVCRRLVQARVLLPRFFLG